MDKVFDYKLKLALKEQLEALEALKNQYQCAINFTQAFLGTNYYHIHHTLSKSSIALYEAEKLKVQEQIVDIKYQISIL